LGIRPTHELSKACTSRLKNADWHRLAGAFHFATKTCQFMTGAKFIYSDERPAVAVTQVTKLANHPCDDFLP
jgi:hypothetical protein